MSAAFTEFSIFNCCSCPSAIIFIQLPTVRLPICHRLRSIRRNSKVRYHGIISDYGSDSSCRAPTAIFYLQECSTNISPEDRRDRAGHRGTQVGILYYQTPIDCNLALLLGYPRLLSTLQSYTAHSLPTGSY